jgi:hypothetical protein
MKNIAKNLSFWVTLLTGLGLIFIGGRFLISPEAGEAGFGIHVPTGNDYSFHYIKGIRDIFSGLIVVMLLLTRQYRALGMVLLCAAIIPMTDLMIVFSQPDYETSKLYPHDIAIVIAIVFGLYYSLLKNNK